MRRRAWACSPTRSNWSHPTSDIRHRLRDGGSVALLEAAAEVLPAEDPDLVRVASRFQHRWDFDRPHEGMRIVGEAFGNGPVAGALHGQTRVEGVRGRGFLNSYHGGDGSVGRVELPAFTITGGLIHVRVGGGRDCNDAYVGLEIDGVVRRRACGQNDEVLRDAVTRAASRATRAHRGGRRCARGLGAYPRGFGGGATRRGGGHACRLRGQAPGGIAVAPLEDLVHPAPPARDRAGPGARKSRALIAFRWSAPLGVASVHSPPLARERANQRRAKKPRANCFALERQQYEV